MLFDIKKNDDQTKTCECCKCENVATNKLMLFGNSCVNICDKCLDNTISKLSDDFQFNNVES
jgi:hypothetical protein